MEVAFVGDGVAVRDSKQPDGQVLLFTQAEWDAFVGGAKDGEFDPNQQGGRGDQHEQADLAARR